MARKHTRTDGDDVTRRRLLAAGCGVASTTVLAGCLSGDGGDGGDGGAPGPEGMGDGEPNFTDGGGNVTDGEDNVTDGEGNVTGGDGNVTGGEPAGAARVPRAIDDFLSDANEYTGTIEDATNQSEVTIDVGAGNGFAFAPPAVRVSTGTLVHWQWTGRGALHNVVSVPESDASFDSGEPVQGSEPAYEQTFDQPGTMLYVCEPHRAVGMLGAIEVVQ